MEEQEQPKKYTKQESISLYSFLFVWVTGVTTILSVLCDILPEHFIVHFMLQSLAYAVFYKIGKYTISKGIKLNNRPGHFEGLDMRKRLNDDICCGIPPYNAGRDVNSPSALSTSFYNNHN